MSLCVSYAFSLTLFLLFACFVLLWFLFYFSYYSFYACGDSAGRRGGKDLGRVEEETVIRTLYEKHVLSIEENLKSTHSETSTVMCQLTDTSV